MPEVTYVYDTHHGGSAIRYIDNGVPKYVPLSGLSRSFFLNHSELTSQQLSILRSGLLEGKDTKPLLTQQRDQLRDIDIPQLQSKITQTASGLSNEQVYLLQQADTAQDNVDYYQVQYASLEDLFVDAILIVPTEHTRLSGELTSLQLQSAGLNAELSRSNTLFTQASQLLSSEISSLQKTQSSKTTQRAGVQTTHDNALVQITQLQNTRKPLNEELTSLTVQVNKWQGTNPADPDWGNSIAAKQGRLNQLASYETEMRTQLDGIIAAKWAGRYLERDNQLQSQEIEADLLRMAQNLQHEQGALMLRNVAETFRAGLDASSDQLALVSANLETLRAQETVLRKQLQAAQLAAPAPASIRIEAGHVLAADPRVVQDEFSGFFLYQEQDSGRLFYRDVKGVSEDSQGEPVYTEERQRRHVLRVGCRAGAARRRLVLPRRSWHAGEHGR